MFELTPPAFATPRLSSRALCLQEYFLRSTQPVAALDMRADLMQWDQALLLSQKLDPGRSSRIAYEYAQQLEFRGPPRGAATWRPPRIAWQ